MTSDLRGETGWCGGRSISGGDIVGAVGELILHPGSGAGQEPMIGSCRGDRRRIVAGGLRGRLRAPHSSWPADTMTPTQAPGSRGGTKGPFSRRTTGWTNGPASPALSPGGRSTSRPGSPQGGPAGSLAPETGPILPLGNAVDAYGKPCSSFARESEQAPEEEGIVMDSAAATHPRPWIDNYPEGNYWDVPANVTPVQEQVMAACKR